MSNQTPPPQHPPTSFTIDPRHRGVELLADGKLTVELHKTDPCRFTPRSVPVGERLVVLNDQLAVGATPHDAAGTRVIEEEPSEFRSCFERDRDRIVHSAAFRRLAGKCQVFIAPDNDMLRNRLTHAIEVAQVAGAIATALGLNVALAEAAALAHDCGHGPAGHASEDALSPYLPDGLDHAVYGADEVLTPLNLCVETLDAVRTHSWRLPPGATPEAAVVSIADRVAYVCHDWDDARRAGIVTDDQLPAEVRDVLGVGQATQIGRLVKAIVTASATTGVVCIPEPHATALAAYRAVNYERIYLRPASTQQADKVIRLLGQLTEYYIDAPGQQPDVAAGLLDHPGSGTPEAARLAVRWVNGMTDRFALHKAVEVLGWAPSELPRSA